MVGQASRTGFTPPGAYPKITLPNTDIQLPWPDVMTHGEIDPQKIQANNEYLMSRLSENHWYLNRTELQQGSGTRWATIVIAASNSTAVSKSTADYVCGASDAGTIINAAIAQLCSSRSATTPLGRIVLLEGTYALGATPISSSALNGRSLHIQGMGGIGRSDTVGGTILTASGSAVVVNGSGVGAGSTLMLSDLQITSASSSACIATGNLPLTVTRCSIVNTGSGGCIVQGNSTGGAGATQIYDNNFYAMGTNAPCVYVQVGSAIDQPIVVANNMVKFTGTGTGIRCRNDISTVPTYVIVGNTIEGSSNGVGFGIGLDGNSIEDCLIANNYIHNVGTGIVASGYRHLIVGNLIETCSIGYTTGAFSPQYHFVTSNHVTECSGTGFYFGQSANDVMQEGTIAFNRVSASPLATGVRVGHVNCTNCGVFYNDTYGCAAALVDVGTGTRTEGWFLTAASLPLHHTRHEAGGADELTGNLTANARVGVRKNSTGSTFLRRRINLIEGSNVTLTVADDSGSEEVDITIAASGGGGGGGGSGVSGTVTQVAHGFVAGDVLYFNGTIFAKARADVATTADVVGIVTSVADVDNFTLTTDGLCAGLSGLIAGTVYFLSPTTAGALTAAEPVVAGQVSKPLLVATTGAAGYFVNWRGMVVGVVTTQVIPTGSTMFNYYGFA